MLYLIMYQMYTLGTVQVYLRYKIKYKTCITLKEETFAGRNFRGFAVFSQIRESLFPRNFSKDVIRESFFPRNFLKKSSSANILKKYAFVVIISNYYGMRKISKH